MAFLTRRATLALALLAGCGRRGGATAAGSHPGATPEMLALVDDYAAFHRVPRSLLHRLVASESGYNAGARNGPYYGLMQVHPDTARSMGFWGEPADLLDAATNLRWAGAYLRGAWIVADGDADEAMGWYRRGYYHEARDRGLLVETGLSDREMR